MSTQAPRTAAEIVRNDKLLDLAICEGCGFNPAQYETPAPSFLCEGCVAAAFGTDGIDELERRRSA